MAEFYDDLETRDPEVRERAAFKAIANQIKHAKARAPYFKNVLADIEPQDIVDRTTFARVPVTRKSDLVNIQSPGNPLGGLAALAPGKLLRIFQSPGPTYDAEGFGLDWWGTARALFASGFRAGDIVHNTFSYHFTPAGMMLDAGAQALGCAVFPAGVGNTELQIRAIEDIKPQGYVGTPSFLKTILEKAIDLGKDTSSLKKACVAGEGLPPQLRQAIEAHGIHCSQVYATADLGAIAYESDAREGLIVDEHLFVEIVRPGTGDPVPDGEVGEVVATLFRAELPLIRFATGDFSAVLAGPSPCGRTNLRLKGWMGRADQTTKFKGMFVHPAQIVEIVKRHPEIKKARMIVTKNADIDVMTLKCEVEGQPDGLLPRIAETIQNVCKLKGAVELVQPGTLANDGKVVEDARPV
ncbi:MAG: AMP-binding protein [Proteobacteria bacterium]|nr:AMP-binding protein [Pseudomonadota bacterium]